MGRIIAIGPGGKAQAPQRADDYRDVLGLVLELGLLDRLVLTPACRDFEHADDVRRGLLRSARYFCSCGRVSCTRKHKNYPTPERPEPGCPLGGQRISARGDIVRDKAGKLRVQLQFHDKREAMRAVVDKYGPDPANWPYQASAKRLRTA